MRRLFDTIIRVTSNTTPGAWVYRYIAHHFDRWIFRFTGGKTTFTAWMSQIPIVMVTVVGRKSGLPRTMPLTAIPHIETPDYFYLVASNWGQQHFPAWYYNLTAAGAASCTRDGHTRQYVAHELEGQQYDVVWDHIVTFMPNYALYKRNIGGTRRIPVIEMQVTNEKQ